MEENGSAPNLTALDSLRSILQQVLRITTVDSRIFMGIFAGTDKPLNIILINAEEYRISQNPGQKVEVVDDGRYVGQVLLPWKMIVKVEVHESDDVPKKGNDKRDNTYL
jgi:N-alpha-acetyltransferase 38, NatC auxiliary subunit